MAPQRRGDLAGARPKLLHRDGLRLVVHEVEVVPCLLDPAGGSAALGIGEFAEDRLDGGDHGGEGGGALDAFGGCDDQVVGVLGKGRGAQVGEDADGGTVYYAYTAELYPTGVRAIGMGAASAVGRAGAIIAPVAIGYLYGSVGFTNVFLTLVGALALGVVTIVAFGEKTAGRSLEQREGTTA
ncbi:MFS transporter [Streptomyces californicus]|uniref:MFS transporter n=1 Tax=Streptomyces californicus TaxID=67351 RepID=UPI00382D9C65